MTDRICRECGTALAGRDRRAQFCGPACRKAHNNRRMTRGAVLYDFLMEHRFNRNATDANELRNLLYGLVSEYREQDQAAGRPCSWSDPREFLAANPWLRARGTRGRLCGGRMADTKRA